MTPRGGAREGAGRKQKPNSRKHTLRISDDVWAWLKPDKKTDASARLEELVRREIRKNEREE